MTQQSIDAEQSLEWIAYHYLLGADSAKAAHYGCRAGDKARERGAYAGAGDYYAKVLALTNAPADDRSAATEGQGDVLALQGDYQAANAAYTRASKLGSVEARGKQAILAGDFELLAQTEFSLWLRPWADGAQAWLMAQQGQLVAAAKLVETALTGADDTARPALEALAQHLATREPIGPYQEWISQFVQATLRQSRRQNDLIRA